MRSEGEEEQGELGRKGREVEGGDSRIDGSGQRCKRVRTEAWRREQGGKEKREGERELGLL